MALLSIKKSLYDTEAFTDVSLLEICASELVAGDVQCIIKQQSITTAGMIVFMMVYSGVKIITYQMVLLQTIENLICIFATVKVQHETHTHLLL
jgi:hypothetical protein